MNNPNRHKIIIVGAGAAGMMAARELADTAEVTVLEARHEPGGRILSVGDHMEAGAEFVHGKLPLTLSLIKEAGLTLEEAEGKRFSVRNCEWSEQEEMMEGWDLVLERMENLQEDTTLDAFLETHFAGSNYEKLRHDVRAFAAGFDLADPVKSSVRSLYNEWYNESDDIFRIREGYAALVNYLHRSCTEKGVTFYFNQRVQQIDWSTGSATVITAEGNRLQADKVIVTIPAGIMQQPLASHAIRFTPSLEEYDNAWQQIGYGSVLKVILEFKEAFWPADTGFIISDEAIPTWWTQLPCQKPILTGWSGGNAALQWDLIDDQQVIEHAVHSLAGIFRTTGADIVDKLGAHHIYRWHARETSLGAYSYHTLFSAQARKILSTPVADTLYFAGEALYEGPATATVEAALESGRKIAGKIKN